MTPIERYKQTNSEGNLWIYILSLAKDREVANSDVAHMVFEKFGFLPGGFNVSRVIFRLRQQGFASEEKNRGKKAFRTTKEGLRQLEMMKEFCQNLLQKI